MPYWAVLLIISAIGLVVASLCGLVPTEILAPIDRVPIKFLICALIFWLAVNALMSIHSYVMMTKQQRMISGIFSFVMTFGSALCIAPAGLPQIETAKGSISGTIRPPSGKGQPIADVKGNAELKTGGMDPALVRLITFAMMLLALFYCAHQYGETTEKAKPTKRSGRKKE